jgi:hypothetical protein
VGTGWSRRLSRSALALPSMAVGTALIGVALGATQAEGQEKRPTAREVVTSIQKHIGVPWKTPTVDTFKAGNPDTRVTGIAGLRLR